MDATKSTQIQNNLAKLFRACEQCWLFFLLSTYVCLRAAAVKRAACQKLQAYAAATSHRSNRSRWTHFSLHEVWTQPFVTANYEPNSLVSDEMFIFCGLLLIFLWNYVSYSFFSLNTSFLAAFGAIFDIFQANGLFRFEHLVHNTAQENLVQTSATASTESNNEHML